MFTHHSQVINYLIERFKFQSYLEIGVHVPRHNFDLIKCKFKTGVDPNGAATFTGTSDEFFDTGKTPKRWIISVDLVFIDGLHHSEQVKKDFDNSLDCLNDGGIILIHDTNPEKEIFTQVPRNGLRGRWNGSVYKFMWDLSGMKNIDYRTLKSDPNGLTIVKRADTSPGPITIECNYESFNQHRDLVLNLITDEEFKTWI